MGRRVLRLENGLSFGGDAFGSSAPIVTGEVICYSGMTGFQEVLTDPSYYGYIVAMTFPTIGASGINRDDFESIVPYVKGVIVRDIQQEPSNFRSEETLDFFLKKHNIPGMSGVDTRMLTRTLREKGTLVAVMHDGDEKDYNASIASLDKEQLKGVSTTRPYIVPGRGRRLVMVDLGMKQSILLELTERDCHVTVVPSEFSKEEIVQFKPDGILLSHGPGNPLDKEKLIQEIKELFGIPLLGIGLGHQLMALAAGAKTTRLKTGQYGNNFPVKNIKEDKTWITTKSHHYVVQEKSLEDTALLITYRSLNDGTIEGLSHANYPAFSVQFNPEGAPGSNETNFIYDQF